MLRTGIMLAAFVVAVAVTAGWIWSEFRADDLKGGLSKVGWAFEAATARGEVGGVVGHKVSPRSVLPSSWSFEDRPAQAGPLLSPSAHLLGFAFYRLSFATTAAAPNIVVVILPYWALCCLAWLAALVIRWRGAVARRRSIVGLCPTCGYDLRASHGRCPECGAYPAPPLHSAA